MDSKKSRDFTNKAKKGIGYKKATVQSKMVFKDLWIKEGAKENNKLLEIGLSE